MKSRRGWGVLVVGGAGNRRSVVAPCSSPPGVRRRWGVSVVGLRTLARCSFLVGRSVRVVWLCGGCVSIHIFLVSRLLPCLASSVVIASLRSPIHPLVSLPPSVAPLPCSFPLSSLTFLHGFSSSPHPLQVGRVREGPVAHVVFAFEMKGRGPRLVPGVSRRATNARTPHQHSLPELAMQLRGHDFEHASVLASLDARSRGRTLRSEAGRAWSIHRSASPVSVRLVSAVAVCDAAALREAILPMLHAADG